MAGGHAPRDDGAHRHHIGATVVVDDTLGPSGGAGRVVEREALPLVLRHDPVERGVSLGNKFFIECMAARGGKAGGLVRHFDDRRRCVEFGAGGFRKVDELRVHQHHFCLTMAEDVIQSNY